MNTFKSITCAGSYRDRELIWWKVLLFHKIFKRKTYKSSTEHFWIMSKKASTGGTIFSLINSLHTSFFTRNLFSPFRKLKYNQSILMNLGGVQLNGMSTVHFGYSYKLFFGVRESIDYSITYYVCMYLVRRDWWTLYSQLFTTQPSNCV